MRRTLRSKQKPAIQQYPWVSPFGYCLPLAMQIRYPDLRRRTLKVLKYYKIRKVSPSASSMAKPAGNCLMFSLSGQLLSGISPFMEQAYVSMEMRHTLIRYLLPSLKTVTTLPGISPKHLRRVLSHLVLHHLLLNANSYRTVLLS